jgi:hypothetical protein
MVAYSFKERFAEAILDGTKGGTIRGNRKRHARPGEELQLYRGMRTKQCVLIARKQCLTVEPITLDFWKHQFFFGDRALSTHATDGRILTSHAALERFARFDGFSSLAEMVEFWRPPQLKISTRESQPWLVFRGWHIRWLALPW